MRFPLAVVEPAEPEPNRGEAMIGHASEGDRQRMPSRWLKDRVWWIAIILRTAQEGNLIPLFFSSANERRTVDLKLAGQPAVIVGSARGIGRAIAQAFTAEGAQLVLIDRAEAVR